MKSHKYITAVAMLVFAVSSCYKEDALKSELGDVPYKIEDSSDPSLHYVYEFNRNTGVYILTDYSEPDYKWNVSTESNYELVGMDKSVIADAVDYVKSVLTEVYPADFAKKYFPLKVMLADTVRHDTYDTDMFRDMTCITGRSYIAIGKLRDTSFPMSWEDLTANRGAINGMLWANIIYTNGLMEIPDGFFSPSEDYYGASLSNDPGKNDPATLKKIGLWHYDEFNLANDFMLPSKAGDVSDFVEMILTHSSEQMQEEMEGFDNLKIKYNILIKTIKDACGVDLQALGDKYTTYLF